mmetsp:Transcript_4617/g.3318  ORF Transcript_4617/g.3318 Transcript_4617/m.3318 type:complete len:118 (+) Transcript_4617:167-520(+)
MRSYPPYFFHSHDFQLHFFRGQTMRLGGYLISVSYFQVIYGLVTLLQLLALWYSIAQGLILAPDFIEDWGSVRKASLLGCGFCLVVFLSGAVGLRAYKAGVLEAKKSLKDGIVKVHK